MTVGNTDINVLEGRSWYSTGSREIHPDGLPGMSLLESALEVVEAGLGVPDNGGLFREV